MASQRATIVRVEDLARAAGVSTATVSYALTGTRGVSSATRRKIQRLADKLGYVPNRQAAALRGRRSFILGCLIPDIKNPFYADIVCGLESAAAERNYRLMLCVTGDDPVDEARHMQMLMEHNIDALVLAPVVRSPAGDYPNLPLLRLFQGRQIPIMCLVDSIKELDTGRITTAVYAGTRLLADHLISLGHRRIAYFSQPFQRILKYGRHAACQDAMRAADIPHHPALLVETGLTPQDAFRETNSLLERGVSFTAAMYPNDYMAIGGLRALRLSGLRVPEDVSVTGFDDVDWARFCEVPLTTVAFAARQLGEMAIREIVEHLSSEEGTAKRPLCDIDIRPQLVVRDSTGPAPH